MAHQHHLFDTRLAAHVFDHLAQVLAFPVNLTAHPGVHRQHVVSALGKLRGDVETHIILVAVHDHDADAADLCGGDRRIIHGHVVPHIHDNQICCNGFIVILFNASAAIYLNDHRMTSLYSVVLSVSGVSFPEIIQLLIQ